MTDPGAGHGRLWQGADAAGLVLHHRHPRPLHPRLDRAAHPLLRGHQDPAFQVGEVKRNN